MSLQVSVKKIAPRDAYNAVKVDILERWSKNVCCSTYRERELILSQNEKIQFF